MDAVEAMPHRRDEEEICRVCRCEGTPEAPLFHPCKCSGSIRYVHEDCLIEWLSHSRKKYCELCKHPFSFTPVYSPDMPANVPIFLFFRRMLIHSFNLFNTLVRAAMVGTVWLVLLPYVTVWMWRFYFWSGNNLATGMAAMTDVTRAVLGDKQSAEKLVALSANQTSLMEAINYATVRNVTSSPMNGIAKLLEDEIVNYVMNTTILSPYRGDVDDVRRIVNRVGTLMSTFFADCFQGQIITCVVVIVFVAAFLLREWIIQNTPHDFDDRFGIDGDLPDHALAHEEVVVPPPNFAQQGAMLHGFQRQLDEAELRQDDHVRQDFEPLGQHTHTLEHDHDTDEAQTSNAERPSTSESPTENKGKAPNWLASFTPNDESSEFADLEDPALTNPLISSTSSASSSENGGEHANESHIYNQSSQGPAFTSFQSVNSSGSEQFAWPGRRPETDHMNSDGRSTSDFAPNGSLEHRHNSHHDAADRSRFHLPENTPDWGQAHPQGNWLNRDAFPREDGGIAPQDRGEAVPEPGLNVRLAPREPPVDAAEDDDMEPAGDDMDGVLEAIGMRGSLWMLVQNSALMMLLIGCCLGVAIWIPFIFGKTLLMLSPTDLIQLPLFILRCITDPLVDFVLDVCLPAVTSKFNNAISSYLQGHDDSTVLFIALEGSRRMMDGIQHVWFELFHQTSSTTGTSEITQVASSNATSFISHLSHLPLLGAHIAPLDQQLQTTTSQIVSSIQPYVDRGMALWESFGTGSSPMDRFACIVVGYAALIALGAWYLARSRNAYGQTVGRAAQQAIRQQGIILKVAFFIAIELIIFPIVCGILLDLSTFPLFAGATIRSRWQFHVAAPLGSTFLHWFCGTGFMFHFAVFVTLCREIVRPGVMWFIRDPNDPQFHPIKEILEKPMWTQLKKIGASGLMYSAMILLGIGSVVWTITFIIPGLCPLNLSFTSPALQLQSHLLSEFPIDLHLYHIIVPLTISYANPKAFFKKVFETWWHFAARQLRLTSFMFDERRPDEEGTHVHKTWSSWLKRERAVVTKEEDGTLTVVTASENVAFVKDGHFVRAPHYDAVPIVPGRRMLVPVDEHGEAIDPSERAAGHPAAAGLNANDPGTVVVYVPPNFRQRIMAFLFLMWLCGSVFACSITILPLALGRYLLTTFVTSGRAVHDIYTITTGLYLLWALLFVVRWTWQKVQAKKQNQARITLADVVGFSRVVSVWVVKMSFLVVAFGLLLPLLFGLLMELYLIMPIKPSPPTRPPVILLNFVQDWALGVLYMKIAYRIVTVLPNETWKQSLEAVFADGWQQPNVKAAAQVLLPTIAASIAALVLPSSLAWLAIKLLAIRDPLQQTQIFRYTHPTVLTIVLLYIGHKGVYTVVKHWIQSIREEEYLVGRRLHNLDEDA